MYPTSPLLRFAENQLQIVALLFMVTIYALRIRRIFRFPAGRDRQAPGGSDNTNETKGAVISLLAVAMPWTMASTRNHLLFYAQFVIFHLGIAASIALSFVIPYAPALLRDPGTVTVLQLLLLAAVLVGVVRLVRRLSSPYMRAISSPDDYFSLCLLIVWLLFGVFAAPNEPQTNPRPLLAYFFLTAFFPVYIPFSKIFHYIYYPFARWYLGRTLGHRGVYPLVRGA